MPAISMNDTRVEEVLGELWRWCQERDFAGYDPYDALNSRVFAVTPFQKFGGSRLLFTQLVKRSPVNLRTVLGVPAEVNSKGIALFSLAALSKYRRLKTSSAEQQAGELLARLLEIRLHGYSGVAWGYNFDWQSRNFFAPRGTPTIVPTAFAVRALTEAFEMFGDRAYLDAARSVCEFVTTDLKRTVETDDELCFSYSPLDHTRIFNATLFAGEILATVSRLTGEDELCNLATKTARYVVRNQQGDGSWNYGAATSQSWKDNFHTAYVLQSLSRIIKCCPSVENEFRPAWERGVNYWRATFFLADGWPKYYHDALYPADAHSAATAIVTLAELSEVDKTALPLANRIASWTINNLRHSKGFFYYQRRRFHTIRVPFMRWTQAWMAYAFARLTEAQQVAK